MYRLTKKYLNEDFQESDTNFCKYENLHKIYSSGTITQIEILFSIYTLTQKKTQGSNEFPRLEINARKDFCKYQHTIC